MLDALLVPIDDQVKIRLRNYRIALEKSQPDVIYKVCLAILQQYSFFNAFTRTADAPEIYMQQFWNTGIVSGENVDFAELIWEDFKFQINSRKSSKQKQELLPFSRFTKLIIKHIISKNNNILKRPHSYHYVIKIDQASADYTDYLEKSKGGNPKGHGKGLVSKKGVEVVVEKIASVRVPRKKRTETVIEQCGQSKGVEDDADFEEIEEEDEIPLLDLKKARKANKEDFILQQRPKGSGEGSSVASEVPDWLNLKGLNEGYGVTPAVPGESSGSSSSSISEYKIKEISSDDEGDEVDDNEKVDVENAETDKAKEAKAEEEHVEDQGGNEQAEDEQGKVHMSEP
ncbi:hypothetical protein Tco_0922054 [Tanacetum coccineum]|uniref:Uncharacterized protein n=1 Tax=Tanacetum coccineum TaxID=301880 RepID=A0ABQ5CX15_9ASTR